MTVLAIVPFTHQRPEFYLLSIGIMTASLQIIESAPVRTSPLAGPMLQDQFGRTFDYLRMAINTQCNLRCLYCMPQEGLIPACTENLMTEAQMIRVIRIASELGVHKIRFTGGEPLLHPQILSLVQRANSIPGIDSVHLTSNGVMLKDMAQDLAKAGLKGINISIDSLDAEKYRVMTRRNTLERTLAGLNAALCAEIQSVKINTVVLRGFNDNKLVEFIRLIKEYPITLRFIELMPFDAQQIWKTGKFVSAEHIKCILREHFPTMYSVDGTKTEHYIYKIPGHRGKVAIIPAFSRNLCCACNRIRVTADGKIRNCLFSHNEFDLLNLLRNGGNDTEVKNRLRDAMWQKDINGWEARDKGQETRKSMALIGG